MRDVCSLAWLVTRLSWGNRLRRFRRVLFLPRTLISLVIVGGYAGMLLLSVVAARFKDAGPGHHDAASSEELIYVPLALLVFLGFNLYGFGRQAGLAMGHAEARFLLEAPLSRRQIVGYYLARQQPGLAISAAFLSFLRWGMVPGSNLTLFFLGLFLVLEGVLVWGVCGRLLRCSLDDRGRSPAWTRLPLALAVAVVFVCAALARPPHALNLATLRRWLDTPPLAQLLEPLRFLVEGMVSPTLSGGLGALALLAVGDALLVTVALARPTPLEEGTLRQAELFQVFRTQGLRAWRAARRGAQGPPRGEPFSIARPGGPIAALVWKNLIACGRHHTPRLLGAGLVIAAALGVALRRALPVEGDYPLKLAALVLYLTGLASFLSLAKERHDLRMDLPRFELIKAWPLSAREILWGEVLGISLMASGYGAIGWTVAVALLELPASAGLAFDWPQRVALWLSGVPVIAAGVLSFVAVQNAAALLFPTWVKLGPDQSAEVTKFGGYAFVLGLSSAIAGALALGPLLLTVPLYVLGTVLVTPAPFGWAVPAAWLSALLVLVEVWILLRILERRVETFAPSSVA